MTQDKTKYTNVFTIEERKKIIAKTIGELRKAKKLSQKEVAAQIEVSQATYSAYERGRNEPPAEIIVRLSYLFDCPTDILMQRDRTYRTSDDVLNQMAECMEQVTALERQIDENGSDASTIAGLIDIMGKLTEAMNNYAQTESVQKALKIDQN